MIHNRKKKISTNVRVHKHNNKISTTLLYNSWKVMPGLTNRFIKHFFFNPGKYKTSREEWTILNTAIPISFNVHRKKIKGWKWGKGHGILMVHGWNGRGFQFYKFVDPILQAGYSPIIFDGPAHGMSQGRHTSYFEFSDVVREIMNPKHQLNIKAVIGHSLGASAAINCLSKDPYPVKLLLIAPALHLRIVLQQTFLKHGIPQNMFYDIIKEYEKKYGYSIEKDDPIQLIGKIQSEITIIHDKKDRPTPFEHSKNAVHNHPHIQLILTEGLGHSRILKNDRIVKQCIDLIKT